MLPEDIQHLSEISQTITVVFLLSVAVVTLWRKWSDERKAREDDVRRYEQQLEELRQAFDRSRQEMVTDYLDDMRYMAGMKDAAWGVQRPRTDAGESQRLPPFPAESGA